MVNLDLVAIEKMCALIFAHAVTKFIAGLSSLSQTRNDFSANSDLRMDTVSENTLAHLAISHTFISVLLMSCSSSLSASPPCDAASSQDNGVGGFLVFHRFSENF